VEVADAGGGFENHGGAGCGGRDQVVARDIVKLRLQERPRHRARRHRDRWRSRSSR
jgi:hypothetical protein